MENFQLWLAGIKHHITTLTSLGTKFIPTLDGDLKNTALTDGYNVVINYVFYQRTRLIL